MRFVCAVCLIRLCEIPCECRNVGIECDLPWRTIATMRCLLYLLALLQIVLGNLSTRYSFSSTLYDRGGDTYVLRWNFSIAERTIAFAVNVSTTGWVGFGLSPNGGMVNSDVVMGWVRSGRTYFHVSSSSCKIYAALISPPIWPQYA